MQSDPTVSFQQPPDAGRATTSETLSASVGILIPTPNIPGYEVVEELGRGGMGIVYKARHLGLNRIVALKMLLGQPLGTQLDRFRAEAESLARLQHPHIVQVFDVGEHQGCPYLTLEFCGGGSLDRRLRKHTLPPNEAADLIATLADAMQAAHDAGIVHRDLKPANVLLSGESRVASGEQEKPSSLATRHSPLATPKITDFGLAKKLDEVSHTQTGTVLGTPSYMAPEQASGLANEVGPAADLYALGAILYECLTGRPPFHAATIMDAIYLVRNEEPVSPRRLVPSLPRDLETVCLKCLNKDPQRRYPGAGDLARDLRRFLAGEPILARPVSRVQRVVKWARRKPAVAALSAAVLLVTLIGVGAFAWAFREALVQGKAEREQRGIAEERTAEAERSNKVALREKENTEHALALSNIQLAQAIWQEPNALAARLKLEDIPEHKRGWEWRFLRRALDGSLYTIHQYRLPVDMVAFHPDGDLLASPGVGGEIVLSDARTGRTTHVMPLRAAGGYRLRDLTFTPDGKELVIVHTGSGRGEVVQFWDHVSGKYLRALRAPADRAECVAVSPGGKYVAAGQADVDLRRQQPVDVWVWERATGRLVHSFPGHRKVVTRVAFSPDGRRLVSTGGDAEARVWDLQTGKLVYTCKGDRASVKAVAFSPDGRLLATGGPDGRVSLWIAADGKFVASLAGLHKEVRRVAFSPDGRSLAAAGTDNIIALWDTARHSLIRTLVGHYAAIEQITFSPDGHLLASTGMDFTVKVWDVRAQRPALRLGRSAKIVEAAAVAPDSRLLAVADVRGIRLLDGFTGELVKTIADPPTRWYGLDFHPDGRRLAGTNLSNGLVVWDVKSGAALFEIGIPESRFSAPRFVGRKGDRLLALAWDSKKGVAHLWETATWKELRTLALPEGAKGEVAVCPEGRWAAIPTDRNMIRLWNLDTGEERAPLPSPVGIITAVAFSPDGRLLAAGGEGGGVVAWDVATGKKALQFSAHLEGTTTGIFALAFSIDGQQLVTRGADLTVNVWDARTGQRLLGLPLEEAGIRGVFFSPDGRRLFVVDRWDVAVWENESASERRTFRGHAATIDAVAYRPDCRLLATASADDTVRLWDTETGKNLRVFSCKRGISSITFHRDGKSLKANTLDGKDQAWSVESGEELTDVKMGEYKSSSRYSQDGKHMVITDGPVAHIVPNGPGDEREEGRRRQMTAVDMGWHYNEGARNDRAGFRFAAMYHLERLLRVEPWNVSFWHAHARVAARAGMTDRAALSFLRGVLIDPAAANQKPQ